MKGRGVLLGVLVWVAVVAVCSGLTWLVIDAAGQQVLTDRPVTTVRVAAPSAAPTHATESPPTPAPSPSRRPRPSSTPSTPVPPVVTTAPPVGTSGPTAPPPRDDAVERTWRGDPGTVVARCRSRTVSLVSATPGDGYRAEVGSRGPEEVEVTISGGGREVKVRAVCSGGRPVFSVESEGGDD